MEQRNKRPALFILAGLVLVAALGAYLVYAAPATTDDDAATAEATTEEAKKEKAPIPVRTAAIEPGRVSSYISATANLVPENEVKVLAEWEGRVAKLRVEEGDAVAAGQVLAELAQSDSEIARQKAQVRATNAEMAYTRSERLKEQELISPEAFDKALLEREIAKQELAEAEWRLEKTYIRAPFSGLLTQRMVQPGQHVRMGDELFTVADFDPLVARIYLPETDVLALETGRDVRITLKADESIRFEGRIRQISPVVDTATGTVKVTVEATRRPQQVRPGAFVRVDVVRESRAEALLLPKEAVVRELQKAYVFVAKDGVAEKRAVELGLEEGATVEARTGVAVGEQVIVAGQGGLKDGAAIKLLDAAETT